MMSTWPMLSWLGLAMWFAATSCWTVTPNRAAIDESVSLSCTTYVCGVGLAVTAGVGLDNAGESVGVGLTAAVPDGFGPMVGTGVAVTSGATVG